MNSILKINLQKIYNLLKSSNINNLKKSFESGYESSVNVRYVVDLS